LIAAVHLRWFTAVVVCPLPESHGGVEQQSKTTTNIVPVTASTKRESPKIESAGVETGEKTLVEPEDWAGGPAEAAVTGEMRVMRICSASCTFEFFKPRICIRQFLVSIRPTNSKRLLVLSDLIELQCA